MCLYGCGHLHAYYICKQIWPLISRFSLLVSSVPSSLPSRSTGPCCLSCQGGTSDASPEDERGSSSASELGIHYSMNFHATVYGHTTVLIPLRCEDMHVESIVVSAA